MDWFGRSLQFCHLEFDGESISWFHGTLEGGGVNYSDLSWASVILMDLVLSPYRDIILINYLLLFLGYSYKFYLPHEVWCFSSRYTGNNQGCGDYHIDKKWIIFTSSILMFQILSLYTGEARDSNQFKHLFLTFRFIANFWIFAILVFNIFFLFSFSKDDFFSCVLTIHLQLQTTNPLMVWLIGRN